MRKNTRKFYKQRRKVCCGLWACERVTGESNENIMNIKAHLNGSILLIKMIKNLKNLKKIRKIIIVFVIELVIQL